MNTNPNSDIDARGGEPERIGDILLRIMADIATRMDRYWEEQAAERRRPRRAGNSGQKSPLLRRPKMGKKARIAKNTVHRSRSKGRTASDATQTSLKLSLGDSARRCEK